eukprot:CAMPEP_0202338634 /NCGR_PEP_ID=MMETSP1126-20121109/831_1 /ASSEMBLY_ACC=CAM_ASM_000457 /TAXON_ID=3047 /ORGANISM="Dunaliella tertiolecta, Strain CCMP1320" /LENGTH=82 /DNA_ID=CAMNT_0048929051 /DNA_START=43 /DNA_END=291 /DNA_ORIENTATION=-
MSSANAGKAEMLMKVKKPAMKKSMAALENVSFQVWPKSKKMVPMQMHRITYMTSRIQNRPMFLKLLTSMRWVRTKAWYTGFA